MTYKEISFWAALTLFSCYLEASPVPTFWSDSYDAGDGICRCDSTYDHGINTTVVETPCGDKTVPQVCNLILEKYGTGPGSRTYYNTVQCGHQPYNNVADETECPGIPQVTTGTWSGPRCQETGSLWPLEGICEVDTDMSCSESSWTQRSNLNMLARCVTNNETELGYGIPFLAFLISFIAIGLFISQPKGTPGAYNC